MKDLNELIDPACGWVLIDAVSINDSGQIAGNGVGPSGQHGLLLTPRPLIRNLSCSGGQVQFELQGMKGAIYRVEYSRSLLAPHWLTLTNVVVASPPYVVVDPVAPVSGERFYRAVQVP